MAIIKLENMEFYAFHGCYAEEQRVGNHFRVDLELMAETLAAERSDKVSETVNYLEVYELVRDEVMVTSHILEHLARRILDALAERFPAVVAATVTVTKLAPPLGGPLAGVSVTLSF